MRRLLRLFSLLTVFVMLCGFSFAGETAQKKVAVMPFESVSGSAEHRVAEVMTEQVTAVLHNSSVYTVVERTQLAQAIKEINLQNSGIMDASQAIELGKMTGTDYTIVGKVLLAKVVDNDIHRVFTGTLGGGNPYGVGVYIPKYKGKVTLHVRFIDNVTGQVIFARVIEGSKSGNDREVSLDAACQDAAANILAIIRKKNPFIARAVDVENGEVIIDKGAGSGIREGDVLAAYEESRPVKGMDGEILTMKTKKIGNMKVIKVEGNHSVCKICSGSGRIKRGTIVKGE